MIELIVIDYFETGLASRILSVFFDQYKNKVIFLSLFFFKK